jgi:hypothetical protein
MQFKEKTLNETEIKEGKSIDDDHANESGNAENELAPIDEKDSAQSRNDFESRINPESSLDPVSEKTDASPDTVSPDSR